jgi:uncharacterized cupredoxin-like copper-binding protein
MRDILLVLVLAIILCADLVGCAPNATAQATPPPAAPPTQAPASPAPVAALPQPAATSTPVAGVGTSTAAPVPVVSVPADAVSPRGTMQLASFSFSPNTVAARVGQPVRLTLQNGDNIFHEFSLDNSDIDVQVAPGTMQKVDLVFSKPGTYVIACNLTEEGNHRGSGMVGKIEVEPP